MTKAISSGFKLFTDAVENLTGNTLNLFGDVKFNGNVVNVPNDLAVTGSLNALTSEDIKVGVTNLKAEVKVGTAPKIRIFTRELYPIKTFVKQFAYSTLHYLPATSYYQIKDFASDDIIIPFSDYSKISCDENGNYINLNLSNWEADRTYKIEFKVTIDGNTQYFDNDITFRIVKN